MLDFLKKTTIRNYVKKQVASGNLHSQMENLYKLISEEARRKLSTSNKKSVDLFLERTFIAGTMEESNAGLPIEPKADYSNFRMYIIVNEGYGPDVAINSAAHGAMAAYAEWRGCKDFEEWRTKCYKKVTCIANEKELANVMKMSALHGIPYIAQTESRLDKAHILTVMYPVDMTSQKYKALKYLRTYK